MKILLADDHQLLRQALRRALEEAGLHVVGEASDGEEAIRLVDELEPELVVMDVTMPVLDGIEATRRIHADHPALAVVVLTMHGEDALKADAIAAGATAFLSKDSSMQEVVATVRAAGGGDVDLSSEVASSILHELHPGEPSERSEPVESPLTKRETEILQLIADGLSTSEVAQGLFISGKTVKNHLAAIYAKLDARDRTQAVLSGVRIGIVRLS